VGSGALSASRANRRVRIREPGAVEVIEGPAPSPGAGEVLVRTRTVGICGSDLHALSGAHPFIRLPCFPGHEVVGTVEAVAPDVSQPAVGERVLAEANFVCGKCIYCLSGRYNLCEELKVLGCQTDGAMADLFVIPASRLHRVPGSLTDAQAALVEPLSTITHALRSAGDLQGRTVAILGAGTVGLLCLIAALDAGAKGVVVTDLQSSKRERALRLGAAGAIEASSPRAVDGVKEALRGRPDVVFDCVGSQASISQAIQLALKGGIVIVVGVPTADVVIPLPLIQDREVRLQGSAMYVAEDVDRAIDLMARGVVPVEEIVTLTLPLTQAAEGFAAARSGDQVKVQLLVDG
jgi:2-desacetyl-2-hydroxyethyl bacteriochlorophyllide A dehydrogenase